MKAVLSLEKLKLPIGIIAILSSFTFIITSLVNWKVKDDYSVKWTNADNPKMSGSFGGLKASILFDEEYPEKSKIIASIDAGTIRDGANNPSIPGKEALAADKFPLITFESISIRKTGRGEYETTGNLALKGITKKITFPFHFDSKTTSDKFPFAFKETFIGEFAIISKNFNVTTNGVPKRVLIKLNIPVTK